MAITQENLDTLYDNALGGDMVAASGTITIAAGNVVEDNTVTVNGVVYTFKVEPVAGTREVLVGDTNDDSAANLRAKLAAATGAEVSSATYTVADNVITITYKVPGTIGNSFTLAKSGDNITLSAATLENGSNAGATDFAPVAADGLVVELRQDSEYEKNLLALVGVIDALLGRSENPVTDREKAMRQRRALKLVLESAAAVVPVVANSDSDDRNDTRARVRDVVLRRYNGINQPLGGL